MTVKAWLKAGNSKALAKMAQSSLNEVYTAQAFKFSPDRDFVFVYQPPLRKDYSVKMFRADEAIGGFNIPISTPKSWVVAVFDYEGLEFQNAMFVGPWKKAIVMFANHSVKELTAEYAKYVATLSANDIKSIRQSMVASMFEEIEDEISNHKKAMIEIRGRYRNSLNYFTSLFDSAQSKADDKEGASYTFSLEGYPESKHYTSYSLTRRAHSKRNTPLLSCHMYRHVKGKPKLFARWVIEDRIWELC